MHRNRQLASRLSASLVGALAALSLAACGDNVKVVGSIDESTAGSSQGLVSGATSGNASFEGSHVVAYERDEKDPSVRHELGTAKVDADGTYALNLPRSSARVTVEVYASADSDQVLAAGILDSADTASGVNERHMAPLNRESTLEAAIFAEMSAKLSLKEINTVDLRARIDAEMAAAYYAQTGAVVTETRVALAAAVIAAQDARVKAFAKAGVVVTQAELFEASLTAAAQVDASLSAGASADTAWAAFYASVEAEIEASPEAQNEGERAASASFRLTIEAEVDAGAFRTAAVRAAAILEAHVAHVSTHAILLAGNASQAVIDAAAAAGTRLLVELRAAQDSHAMSQAYANWTLSISGQGQASVLGLFVQAGGNATVNMELLVAAANTANAALELALSATVSLLNLINVQAFTDAVVEAIAAHRGAIHANLDALVSMLGDRSGIAVNLVLVANGAFTLG